MMEGTKEQSSDTLVIGDTLQRTLSLDPVTAPVHTDELSINRIQTQEDTDEAEEICGGPNEKIELSVDSEEDPGTLECIVSDPTDCAPGPEQTNGAFMMSNDCVEQCEGVNMMSGVDSGESWSNMMDDVDCGVNVSHCVQTDENHMVLSPSVCNDVKGVNEQFRVLENKYVQQKDVIDRLEMIFNQSIGRLDDQMGAQSSFQKTNSIAISEMRGVIQAIVSVIGEEAVQAKMQEIHSRQGQQRNHEAFGRDPQGRQQPWNVSGNPRGKQNFYTQQRDRNSWDFQGGAQEGGEVWRRRGRGGRRGGPF
jgi:hypothetical protein